MERERYIDIAKAIGILLVVFDHGYSAVNPLYNWVSSFHMPLFFIITGILYGRRKKEFVFDFKRKSYALLIPYIIWGGLLRIFIGMLQYIGNANSLQNILRHNFKIFFALNSGPLWYLPTLFLAELLFSVLLIIDKKLIYVIPLFFGIGFTYVDTIPALISRTLIATTLISFGYFCAKSERKYHGKIVFVITLVISLFVGILNGEMILSKGQIGNPILFIIGAISGTYVILCLSKHISKNRFLEYIGRYSMIILCIHYFITEIIRLVDYKTLNILASTGIAEGFLILVPTVIIMLVAIPICKKYLWWSFGIRRKQN